MRTVRILIAIAVATSLLVGATGTVAAGGNDKKTNGHDKKHDEKQEKNGDGNAKVTICHIPQGNPANAHTITVSENAIPAHLAHGDSLGSCDCRA